MEYTISYTEIRYIGKRSWHSVCNALLPKLLTAAQCSSLNIYSSFLCFHPWNHNHDTKEALMCHSFPVFLRARFNPIQFFNPLQGRNHTISLPDASMHPSNAFSPLRTGLDKCYTTHFRCKSTTGRRKTLLWLTETEHISFAPVMSTILELQPTLQHFSHL